MSIVLSTDEKIRKQQFKWMADNGTRIIKSLGRQNSPAAIYTVPSGKVFYLVSAQLCAILTADGGEVVTIDDGTNNILYLQPTLVANNPATTSVSFPIPLKFTEGESIYISVDSSDVLGVGSITGYEFDA